MNNKLSPQVSLPYSTTRGTIPERESKAKRDVDKLYKELCPSYNRNKLNTDTLAKSIQKVYGKKLNIAILPSEYNPDFDASSDILYSKKTDKISGTTIEIPMFKKKLFQEEFISILHELQHVVDQLYQPKFLARNQQLHLKGLYTDKYNNLYDNHLYCPEYPLDNSERKAILKDLRYKIENFLKGFSVKDKINYIQDSRYTLMLEDYAYKTQAKYAKKLNKKHQPICRDDLIKENRNYMFSEKIKLLTDMGFEIIQKERGKLKARIKKSVKL